MALPCPNSMKSSKAPTAHILIKANTTSEWDEVTFAIIHLSADWKALVAERLAAISQFKADSNFCAHVYWDVPLGYYASAIPSNLLQKILRHYEDYIFVTLEPGEEKTLDKPINTLDAHQLFITRNGIAHYKAYSKHTGEEFRTEEFNLNKFINE